MNQIYQKELRAVMEPIADNATTPARTETKTLKTQS